MVKCFNNTLPTVHEISSVAILPTKKSRGPALHSTRSVSRMRTTFERTNRMRTTTFVRINNIGKIDHLSGQSTTSSDGNLIMTLGVILFDGWRY